MKIKRADFPNWPKVEDKSYINMYVNNPDFKGNISLLTAVKIKPEHRLVGDNDGKEEVLFDDNFKRLEFYPEDNKHVAFMASFNEKDELLHWYFDIAKKTDVTAEGVPYIEDLYLDIMYYKSGNHKFLDEDDLKDALDRKEISKEDFDMAYNVANDVIKALDGKADWLAKFTYKYYKLLKEQEKTKDDGESYER